MKIVQSSKNNKNKRKKKKILSKQKINNSQIKK